MQTTVMVKTQKIWCLNAVVPILWFERLLEDPSYSNLTRCVWEEYRASEWSNESIHIDSLEVLLTDASIRDHTRWPRLGQYVWPNAFVGDTYEEELDFLRGWVDGRLEWLDANISGECFAGCTDEFACNYNPSANYDDSSCEYTSCVCPYDLNFDEIVAVDDILLTLAQYGCMANCTADFNDDGIVNVLDLLDILSYFGGYCN